MSVSTLTRAPMFGTAAFTGRCDGSSPTIEPGPSVSTLRPLRFTSTEPSRTMNASRPVAPCSANSVPAVIITSSPERAMRSSSRLVQPLNNGTLRRFSTWAFLLAIRQTVRLDARSPINQAAVGDRSEHTSARSLDSCPCRLTRSSARRDRERVRLARQQRHELLVDPPRIRRFDVLAHKLPAGSTVVKKPADVTKGALLQLPPKRGKAGELAHFLEEAQPIVEQEDETTAWFAFRLDDGVEGIFDVFPDAGGRMAHLTGQVPRALLRRGLGLLGGLPHLQLVSVVAAKLPE